MALLQLHLHCRINTCFNGLGKDNCKTRRETFKFFGFGAAYIRCFTVYLKVYAHGSFIVVCVLVCHRSILCISFRITSLDWSWWRHQMETFSALLAICAGNSPVIGEIFSQRPVTRGFDNFFDLGLNERLSKESWSWWFETPSCPLWGNNNVWINTFRESISVDYLMITKHNATKQYAYLWVIL